MDFKKLSKLAGDLGGKVDLDNLNMDKIITDEFIAKNTTLASLKAFIDKSGFDVKSIVDFKNLPMEKLDVYVKSISSFDSWKDMLMKAALKK